MLSGEFCYPHEVMLNSESSGPGLEFVDCHLLAERHKGNNLYLGWLCYLTRRKVLQHQPQLAIRGLNERTDVKMCFKRLLNKLLRIMLSRRVSTQRDPFGRVTPLHKVLLLCHSACLEIESHSLVRKSRISGSGLSSFLQIPSVTQL